jgi:uncharacterized protein YktB (UPF0637 family)
LLGLLTPTACSCLCCCRHEMAWHGIDKRRRRHVTQQHQQERCWACVAGTVRGWSFFFFFSSHVFLVALAVWFSSIHRSIG